MTAMATKPFPILFITPTDIGGAIASSGLVKLLADQVPNAQFTFVADEDVAPLFAAVPNREQTIIAGETDGRLAKFGLWSKVRGRHWGLVVDLRGTGIGQYLRRSRRGEYRPNRDYLHPVVQAARVLGMENDPPDPHLYTTPELDEQAAGYLGPGGPVVVMAPEADWSGRIWPTERFAQVANRLFAADGPLPNGRLLVLGDGEEGEGTELARFSGIRLRVIGRPGDLDLMQAYACLKRARLFIGNDTLWMHLAAAAGTPTLGLFGPSDEEVARPWGRRARTVRGPRPFQSFLNLDPGLNQAISHMMDLPTQTVFEAAVRLLEET